MIITYIINKHMPLDFFKSLNGRCITITCTDLNKNWNCMIEDKLYIIDSEPDNVDVIISGTTGAFMQYALRQDRSSLHITGNIAVAELIQQLLARINIDWEEELSRYTGDVIAHQTMRFMQQFRHLDIDRMLAEYLQEEAKMLPTKYEVQDFLHAVDELRTDVDRLEARIKHASNN